MVAVKILRCGTEEGDYCNREGCNGKIGFDAVENCSCHLGHAPCSACTSQRLSCLRCGWEDEAEKDIFEGIFGSITNGETL